MITNYEARDEIVAKIKNAKPKEIFAASWEAAKWLARGERAVGLKGGFKNMVIYSPAGAQDCDGFDKFYFYGSTGVLVHEQPATSVYAVQIGFEA